MNTIQTQSVKSKLPQWLKRPVGFGQIYNQTSSIIEKLRLHTICENANCPNRGLCWSKGTATVLILGNVCTRNCGFCSVTRGKPQSPDSTEPQRIAEMAQQLNLKYLVITSVNRDDLSDAGAAHFRDCIQTVRQYNPNIKFEILVPDFRGCQENAISILRTALPLVFAHNIETVPSLYRQARAGGDYELSLNLLKLAKKHLPDTPIKSSIMLGLSEADNEIIQVLKDLRKTGCERITIGQYLKPSKNSLEVAEYIIPQKFDFWKRTALELGFKWVISEPFARSSYLAETENLKS
ncbi:MAG: lipoyl synthase [Phycisphaerae bacterium]